MAKKKAPAKRKTPARKVAPAKTKRPAAKKKAPKSKPAAKPTGGAAAYERLVERSKTELAARTAAHDGTWHLGESSWDVDQEAGTIVFRNARFTATAPVQIVGTYDTLDDTWLWGWDHPSVLHPLQEAARAVLAHGRKHGIVELTTRKLDCPKDDAWTFTALACALAGGEGGYCCPAGPTLVFVTFGTVTLSGP